ncbi:hypothetical protein GE09DRAFT_1195535 [Coniochaeta sp. 2T2.1]|nr:hypothetical protein GE09DRAFT_1195535 [Coniochaeta sp. 2T2.1]
MPPILSTMRTFAVLYLAVLASARQIVMHNHCPDRLHIDQVAPSKRHSDSYDLSSGNTAHLPMVFGGVGISLKVSREHSTNDGIWQLEYTVSEHVFWDVSDLDGAGPGKVASPFFDANVRVTPTGRGAQEGSNGCYTLWCKAGETCAGAYQYPDQEATNVCPIDTGDLVVDLCLSDEEMEGGGGSQSGDGDEGEWEGEADEEEKEEEEEEKEDDEEEGQWNGHGHGHDHWDHDDDWHGGRHWEEGKMAHGRRGTQ